MVFFFFFFKQKTAYEMRISDWSSDVCSSDLLIHGAFALREQQIMLIVLGLIDVVMISNLLVMVIVGGYETLVSRLGLERHPDQPEWLSHVNASVLKVKLAMSIIGISSINLLKHIIEAGTQHGRTSVRDRVLQNV